MKKNQFSKRKLIITLTLMFCLSQAKWIPFENNVTRQEPQINLIASNQSSLTLDVDIYGFETEIINTQDMLNTQNETFVLFTIPECFHVGDIGKPKLPAIKRTMGVPYDAQIEIEVIQSEYKDISLQSLDIKERIMPALESVIKLPGQKPTFVIDEAIYSQNMFYPQNIIRIENDDMLRGHRLAVIEIVPIQYNPVKKRIRFYTRVQIRINFIGADMLKTKELVAHDYSRLYEDFIEKRVLNYELYEQMLRGVPALPIHYLFVTHNNFESYIQPLAEYYKKIGFKVKVATQDSISPWTKDNIRAFIHNQSPYPTFVTLVGDENGYLPAFTSPVILNEVTDLYYAEMDYSGYLPDLGVGRLPCINTTEAQTMVNKILTYRRAQFATTGWIKHDAFCAGNDYYWISEGTHNYCTSNFMNPNGYTTHKLYEVTYGANTQDVINTLNAGVSIITMSGHGYEQGWSDGPQFLISHLNTITNGDMLPIATGHACYTNEFHTNPVFGEKWLKRSNGGGIAYWGASCYTYWDEDDWLEREWYEAIYVDELYEHSRFTQDGMYDGVYMSGSGMKQYYYEEYNIMGDPSLDLWTDIPVDMVIEHDPTVMPEPTDFIVTVKDDDGVTPLEDALVCCWIPDQTPEMHVSDYTDASGTATLSISPANPGDIMYVTVTKHNYIPYEGQADITQTGHVLNLNDFPMRDAEIPYNEKSGAAVAQMALDYIWWDSDIDPEPPVKYTQSELYTYGLDYSEADPYFDLDGMWHTVQDNKPMPYSQYGYNFSKRHNSDQGEMLKQTCQWIDYTVGTYGGYEEGHPYHVPAIVPAYGAYTNWMAVRGIHTDQPAYPMPPELEIYGFWVNDPVRAGIGENTYKTISEWSSTYYLAMTIGEYIGEYLGVFEPPEAVEGCELTLASPIPRFTDDQINQLELIEDLNNISLEMKIWIVQAAINGVTEELIPYDENFKAVFETTMPGEPFFVQSINNNDYFAVPFVFGRYFGEVSPKKEVNNELPVLDNKAMVVILIDASDGSFKEASWTEDPSAYLPLSRDEAREIAFKVTENLGLEVDINSLQPELVHRQSTPYYPEWLVIIEKYAIYISQDGTVSIEEFVEGGTGSGGVMSEEGSFVYSLNTAAPTPFVNSTMISYSIAQSGHVSLNIYDVTGRLVKTLVHANKDAGVYILRWNGYDNNDRKVAPGVYFTKLTSRDFTSVKKIILAK